MRARRVLIWGGAFLAAAWAGAWRLWAGTAVALALAAWTVRGESLGLEPLKAFLAALAAGEFGVRLPSGGAPGLEELRHDLEAIASSVGGRILEAEALGRRLRAALDGMREGVALCDAQGAILLLNPAFRSLAGFDQAMDRRRHLREAVRDPQLNAAVEAALRTGLSSRVDLPLDQGRVEGRALVTPIDGPVGGIREGAAVFLLDRTEERRVERLRSEFVANVSHELRTPVSAIKAALETLRDGALDDPAVNQVFLGKAIHHGERLEELLADLLSLSQIEEKRRRGLVDPAASSHVAEAWSEAEGQLEPALRRHHGTVTADLPDGLPRVAIERGALRQILLNYVENALKYSGAEPEVGVGARPDGAWVELWVQDRGPGIPEADLPRVFERFFRVERARTRLNGGSGLGLSIVKHLAENAGGQVGVDCRPGGGCRFWVRLPCVPA